jgi:hypothetical protein
LVAMSRVTRSWHFSSDGSFSSNSTHQQETNTLQLGNFFGLSNSTSHSLGSRCQDSLTQQNRTIRDVVWESKNLHFFERNESRSLHWNKEIAKSDTEKMSAVKSFSSSGWWTHWLRGLPWWCFQTIALEIDSITSHWRVPITEELELDRHGIRQFSGVKCASSFSLKRFAKALMDS